MNTNWDQAKEYEGFLRCAFGLKQGIRLKQNGDPAKAADTKSFSSDNLEGVKAATAYAMMIYQNDIAHRSDVPQSDRNRLNNYVKDVINSSSLEEISDLITGFNESFVNRYYEISDGRIIFKEPSNEPL
jgi:hypothetical protein